MNLEGSGARARSSEGADPMPICGYVVVPRPGELNATSQALSRIQGCEVVPAKNRDVLLLVTDTYSGDEDRELRRQLDAVPGIQAVLMTFGEIDSASTAGHPEPEANP